ncbi:laccase-14 [Andrographis paniculata]|uniref:laccase-14 n=1 Tax=Andrographis paniculata TaxID=175694 RepID=UPI0021E7ED6B|nr:laccase-14 [Andrographis paniculata]
MADPNEREIGNQELYQLSCSLTAWEGLEIEIEICAFSEIRKRIEWKSEREYGYSYGYGYGSLLPHCNGRTHHHTFLVQSTPYTRLCNTKNILTVNGKFPGPTLEANRGDTLIVDFRNRSPYNLTLHWHGVRMPRNPWADGAEYVNQCPIRPESNFRYRVELSREEGTVWWHAHSGWARATVHGVIIVRPRIGISYPFPEPFAEVPIVLGEWWKANVMDITENANKTGREPILSDAYTINGHPGDLYLCSKQNTFKITVMPKKTYLFRIVSAVMEENLFFAIANHKLTVVGTDGFYTKPFETDHIMIAPGQTMDVLLNANQSPELKYYMAARAYAISYGAGYDNTTTTAILQYANSANNRSLMSSPVLVPTLPPYTDTQAATQFTRRLRSLASKDHPVNIPVKIKTNLFLTWSVNLLNCTGVGPCGGPLGRRFAASVNNVSFVHPTRTDILQAYYYNISGIYTGDFPRNPPHSFDYTAKNLTENLLTPEFGTRAVVLEYNAGVEVVLQGTNLVASDNHPIHLHGHGFYMVGWGFGKFDPEKDPSRYNLVDPPQQTTVGIPDNGWVAIRFRADNPGVWFMHCHLERHQSWGMSTVIVVKNKEGKGTNGEGQLLPPPPDLPHC